MPASSNRWLVWRMPSRPQSVAWLFARDITSNPIALRSLATDGAPMIQTPPNSACGTAGVRERSMAVPSKLPNAESASWMILPTGANPGV